MAQKLLAPRAYPIRKPTDNNRRHGAVINPPRLAEVGGMTKSNADQREPELRLKKPGGTRG